MSWSPGWGTAGSPMRLGSATTDADAKHDNILTQHANGIRCNVRSRVTESSLPVEVVRSIHSTGVPEVSSVPVVLVVV